MDITRKPIKSGDITWTWCSKHNRTDHLWNGHILICLDCHPELKPKEEDDEKPLG